MGKVCWDMHFFPSVFLCNFVPCRYQCKNPVAFERNPYGGVKVTEGLPGIPKAEREKEKEKERGE